MEGDTKNVLAGERGEGRMRGKLRRNAVEAKSMRYVAWLQALCAVWAAAALAQSPVVDGALDAEFYGAALSVQDTPTGFGNATNGHPRFAVGGSELDAAYARVSDGYLYLFLAGNLETYGQGLHWPTGNRNKLDVFIDSIPGGQNSLRGDNAEVDGGALGRMGHLDPANDGLKFDAGFEADFYLTFQNYTEVVAYFSPPQVEAWRGMLHYATLPTGGGGRSELLGLAMDATHTSHAATFEFANGVKLGFNNGNAGGVRGVGEDGESDTTQAGAVGTGLELAIPIHYVAAADGTIGGNIRILAFVNDSGHGHMSNQVLGPMGQTAGGYGNLGEPRQFNFSEAYSPGEQYFEVENGYFSARAMLAPEDRGDGTSTCRWLGEVGHTYALQATTNLATGEWADVGEAIAATNPVLSAVATNAGPSGYYRARRTD